MRSQLAFTMDSMYGRDGTSAYPCMWGSCQKEYPKFSLTGMRGQQGGIVMHGGRRQDDEFFLLCRW